MSFRPNTPVQFSAGVGQEPQTPALAPRPHPAQSLRYTLNRTGTKYRSGHSRYRFRTSRSPNLRRGRGCLLGYGSRLGRASLPPSSYNGGFEEETSRDCESRDASLCWSRVPHTLRSPSTRYLRRKASCWVSKRLFQGFARRHSTRVHWLIRTPD